VQVFKLITLDKIYVPIPYDVEAELLIGDGRGTEKHGRKESPFVRLNWKELYASAFSIRVHKQSALETVGSNRRTCINRLGAKLNGALQL
jgi:hypothetical protein